MAGGLASALNAPDGITLAQACELAAVNMDWIRDKAIAAMNDALRDILRLCDAGSPSPAERQEMHSLSCSIAGAGGMFDFDGLSKAAHCFCRLLDETEPGWDAEAVAVHLGAMRLLLSPARGAAEEEALVEGLAKVRRLAASRNN